MYHRGSPWDIVGAMATKMKSIHVRLPRDIRGAVEGIAEKEKWSVSLTAGVLIEEAIETRWPKWREPDEEAEEE